MKKHVLEVRKYGSSQHREEPWEGFYNSPPTPLLPSWEEGKADMSQGLMAPQRQIHFISWEADSVMNASVRGLDGTGPCCSSQNFSLGEAVPGSEASTTPESLIEGLNHTPSSFNYSWPDTLTGNTSL